MTFACRRFELLPVALLMLSACSDSVEATDPQSLSTQVFSSEDKRVANLLSIGQSNSDAEATPQYRATLCSLALAVINERVQASGALSEEQQRAFSEAQALFQRRATAGLSLEESGRTRKQIEERYPEPTDRARFAIGCLRDLT